MSTLRGMATVSFFAKDLDAATAWYTELFGAEPYFAVPGYREFRIGDHEGEFGLIDAAYAPGGPDREPGGAILYWHVDDVEAVVARLLEMGAVEYQPVTVRGEGFTTASVVDPFGNVLGVMFNRHYLEMLGAKA